VQEALQRSTKQEDYLGTPKSARAPKTKRMLVSALTGYLKQWTQTHLGLSPVEAHFFLAVEPARSALQRVRFRVKSLLGILPKVLLFLTFIVDVRQ
jgi:hypothetical protein